MSSIMQTYTGRAFNIDWPKAEQVHIDDILYPLANLNRFNGHTRFPWSVLQHSLLCMRLAEQIFPGDNAARLHALMHDFHEAYVGDITTPQQFALRLRSSEPFSGMSMVSLTVLIDRAIYGHLGFERPEMRHEQQVKHIDAVALATERKWCLNPAIEPIDWGEEVEPAEEDLISEVRGVDNIVEVVRSEIDAMEAA
ncbi:MAG: hypothetical protein AAF468_12385 [Pseudomonadota bacterium]